MSRIVQYKPILILVLLYVVTVAYFWHQTELDTAAQQLRQSQTQNLKAELDRVKSQQKIIQSGLLTTTQDDQTFHGRDLNQAISNIPNYQNSSNFIWQDSRGNPFAYAAKGVDRNYYFASSYLIGYEPYKTDKIWQPLVTLAIRKTYQFDHEQYGHQWQDIWQNSYQAYLYSHGDCEDHAILLADWLIAMGYDARVAVGRIASGGHAWVVLFHQGQEYLLEATNKRRPRSIGDFKLAKYAPEYRPEYLFNRSTFWANKGSTLTTRYSGNNWQKTAQFTPDI